MMLIPTLLRCCMQATVKMLHRSYQDWLSKDKIVLLDRYTYSNIAYQCAKIDDRDGQDKLMNWILELEFRHFEIPRPDLNIFLDVPFAFAENNLYRHKVGK